jgi:phosphohistidine phosphatase
MPRLHLLRHAKSSWDDPGLADRDRPLAPRGRRAAERMAEHLRAAGVRPALVLCSSAVRARQTLTAVADALGDPPTAIEDALYLAEPEDVLGRLRAVPDADPEVLVIGHNPTLQELALELARDGSDLPRLREKLPTGALVTLAFEGPWRDLGPGRATLVAFVTPRDLR